MTRLVLIRHGRTAWNTQGRMQGRADRPLSAAGRRQVGAWTVPETWRDYDWITSPLKRTRDTAKMLIGHVPPVEQRLIEMDWGRWEGCRLADLRVEMGEEFDRMAAGGIEFQRPGGESPRQVQMRLRPLLAEIADRRRPTVGVTHRGVVRAVYAEAVEWDMTGEPPHELRDDCAQVFTLDRDGRCRVEHLNVDLRAP
ncbi:MAG TPA: histidine phosphatase family protein [Rhodospirillales bacterium]|nr:histidine phosphatase family protein [Rhodospirillales bacterium]